jgi:hypothetical protein
MYLRTKVIGKRLGPRDKLVSNNPKYTNDTKKLVNLWWVSVRSLSLKGKIVLSQANKRKTRVYSPIYYLNLLLRKNIIKPPLTNPNGLLLSFKLRGIN